MKYILKVDSSNIDCVVLKLLKHENEITIRNVLRSTGVIYVKTKLFHELSLIQEIVDIRKETLIPQMLLF